MSTTWHRGELRLQVKAADADFERKHPRDRNGRFIKIGGRVRVSPVAGGGDGTVRGLGDGGTISVERDNGKTEGIAKGYLTVLDEAGNAPPPKPGPREKDAARLAERGVPTVAVPTVDVPPLTPTAPPPVTEPAGFTAVEVDGAAFRTRIAGARSGSKGAFLSLYEVAEYEQMRTFLAHDGKVGGALRDHGDGRIEIVSLFNNGGPPGSGIEMANHLMAQGGNYAECFGDGLRTLYEAEGFVVDESYPFDRSLAAPDWNYERDGEPNYYTLRRSDVPDAAPGQADADTPAGPGGNGGSVPDPDQDVVRGDPDPEQQGVPAERVGVHLLPGGGSPAVTPAAAPAKRKRGTGGAPLDAHGKVIEVGAAVNVFGGGTGTVRANRGGGTIEVEIGGERRAVQQNWLAVLQRPDGTPPTSEPGDADPAPAVSDGPELVPHVPDIAPGAGWPVWPPPDPAAPELTPGQAMAAKYWKTLPTGTRAELEAQLGRSHPAAVPSIDELIDSGMTPDAAAKAHTKATKAAYMKAYDQRLKLQAAIDTLDARERHLPDPAAANAPPTPEQMRAMSDVELADAVGRFADDDATMDAALAELDRRDTGGDAGQNTAEQDRVDELIAGGMSMDEAIAEVYQVSHETITAQNQTGAVNTERLPGESLDQAARRMYDEWVDMETIAAENATRGNLLSPAGKRAGVDPATLFSGPAAVARKYASEELKRWWEESGHPRRTFTQFKADVLGRATDKTAAAATRGQGAGRDFGL